MDLITALDDDSVLTQFKGIRMKSLLLQAERRLVRNAEIVTNNANNDLYLGFNKLLRMQLPSNAT